MKYHPTTANFPGTPFLYAVEKAHGNPSWDCTHMQLCPQQLGVLNSQIIDDLQNKFSETKFRLHANVRMFKDNFVFDASNDLKEVTTQNYLTLLTNIHKKTNSNIYSYHAGYRTCSLDAMKSNALKLQDHLQCLVAVEGLYPERKNQWLVNSLDEYEWLANNLHFALDLSHLQIVYAQTHKPIDKLWVIHMMEHPNCLEIHVSGNEGKHDNHQKIVGHEWWVELMKEACLTADIFTEENYR